MTNDTTPLPNNEGNDAASKRGSDWRAFNSTGSMPRIKNIPSDQSSKRESVTSARDELERERKMYSARDPHASRVSPAQRAADARRSKYADQATGSFPIQGSTDSFSAQGSTGSFTAQGSTGSIPRQHATESFPAQDAASSTGSIPRQQATGSFPAQGETGSFAATGTPRKEAGAKKPTVRRSGAQVPTTARPMTTKRNSGGNARRTFIVLVAVLAIVAIGVFAYQTWDANKAVAVTINDQSYTVEGNQRTISGLLDAGTVSVTAGNYVAVDGSIMREGEGTRCTAVVNDVETTDLSTRLNEGDVVQISNGTDIMESYTDSEPEVLTHSVELQGVGAVHLYMGNGQDGEKVVRTGNESGITLDVVTKEAVNETVQCYNVDTHGDKVIALTFDDGPWDTSTEEILNVLAEYNVKATFFTVGTRIAGREAILQRAASEGHEISTHTYDHAGGTGQGVSLILMSSDERKAEVEQGLEAIRSAIAAEPSTIFRAPGGNFDNSVATDLDGLITAEIGWNVDTTDWKRPGADTIASRILMADSGEIVLMHDGGGNREQTVAALRQALPKLIEEGYTFMTVQELIETYPYEG